MIPDQYGVRVVLPDPVAQGTIPQINRVGELLGLARVPVVDLVGRRQHILHLADGQSRGGLAKGGISDVQEPALGIVFGAPEPGEHGPHDGEP